LFWRINFVQDLEQNRGSYALSLFLRASDPDGFEDLEDIHLINDKEELFWRLDADTWLKNGSGEDTWIGSNSLRMPDGGVFPGGEYRVLLQDVGGEAVEQSLLLPALAGRPRPKLPQVSIMENDISVSGPAPLYVLWVRRGEGKSPLALALAQKRIGIEDIVRQDASLRSGFEFSLYGEPSPGTEAGVIVGPFRAPARTNEIAPSGGNR